MIQTAFLFPDPSLSSLFCRADTEGAGLPGGPAIPTLLSPRATQANLCQQGLQPPPEGSILPAQLLVVCQHSLQPGLQPLQILLLLPAGLAGRLSVLDHALLPLQQLCLVPARSEMS